MIGSVGSSAISASVNAMLGERGGRREAAERGEKAEKTVADHVAAADSQEAIRSAVATRGRMLDTYL